MNPVHDQRSDPGSGISREQLDLAVRGDADASRAIVEALHRSVIATIYRFLGKARAGEVEDIAQEVFLRFFRTLHRFDPDRARLNTWMFAIVKNHCYDLFKKRRIKAVSLADAEGEDAIEPASPRRHEPPQVALQGELGKRIDAAVQELSTVHRMPFVMREYQGLDYKSIGRAIGISAGTVKSRLHRAREALKRILAPYVSLPLRIS